MKKYLKITIVFALTVVIVATMCILPTFARIVEETVTITDKSQLEVGVTYTTLIFDVATSPNVPASTTSSNFNISCGGQFMGYDSIDEENVYKSIQGFSYSYSNGNGRYALIHNGTEYRFYTKNEYSGDGGYVSIDIASTSDNLTVKKFQLTNIQFSTETQLDIFKGFIGNNFISSYISQIEVDDPSPTDSITGIFTNISGWIVTAIGNTVPMFYNVQASELTILGVLAVVGLAIAVIFLLINVIKRFIQFRS